MGDINAWIKDMGSILVEREVELLREDGGVDEEYIKSSHGHDKAVELGENYSGWRYKKRIAPSDAENGIFLAAYCGEVFLARNLHGVWRDVIEDKGLKTEPDWVVPFG